MREMNDKWWCSGGMADEVRGCLWSILDSKLAKKGGRNPAENRGERWQN